MLKPNPSVVPALAAFAPFVPFVLYAAALVAGVVFAGSLTACSASKPGASSAMPAAPTLDTLTFQSDWVGEAYIRPSDVSSETGTVRIRNARAVKDFESLDPIEIPWPFSPPGLPQRDSGTFFLFLRKGPDGRFLTPESGRTAFRVESHHDGEVVRSYVPFRLGKGYPEVALSRAGLAAFGADSGIERYKFDNYLTEGLIFKILTDNDSAHFDYLTRHQSFQSNNANIMLHYLAQSGRLEMMGRFVALGNNVDFSDHDLYSPLWICMSVGSAPCMDTLMAYGANLNLITPDDEGKYRETPLHAAVDMEQPQLVRWLRRNGAGLYFRDLDGKMPLHKAACGDTGIVEALAYANDSLAAKDKAGKTALDHARACGKKKNEALLVEAIERKPAAGLPAARSSITKSPVVKKPIAPDPALAGKPHSGETLFALPRKDRARVAAEALYGLVEVGCGFQGKDLMMSSREAEALCHTLLADDEARASLGPALTGSLGKIFTPGEVDTLLVRYAQTAKGNPFPIWISDRLQAGMREIHSMRREFEAMILQTVIEVAIGH